MQQARDPRRHDQDKCQRSKQGSGGHDKFIGVAAMLLSPLRLVNSCFFAVYVLSMSSQCLL